MNGEKTKIIYMNNLQTSFNSHNDLAMLFSELESFWGEKIILDFRNVSFISANQFAVLGCILSHYQRLHKGAIINIQNVRPKVSSVMSVNGFGRHFSYPDRPDIHNTAIPYKIFKVSQIDEFERYITISIFNRNDIPKMTNEVKHRMIDNILEIFNNVKEHTSSPALYTCGQYFPSKSMLYFTIADSGETISQNVSSFLRENNININSSNLEWAMQSGNSTKKDAPGGLGLYLLSSFITLNEGELYIVSGNETFEQTTKGIRYKYLDDSFNGTIVTMAFNLNDKSSYYWDDKDTANFIF